MPEQPKIPEGYRRTSWDSVRSNEQVVIMGADGRVGRPFWVVDPARYALRSASGCTFIGCKQTVLLYRTGPLAVVHVGVPPFYTVYADIPLELHVVTGRSEALRGRSQRALQLDAMPVHLRDHMDATIPPGWPELFGRWDVTSPSLSNIPQDTLLEVRVTTRVAATALCAELLRTGLTFRCQPLSENIFIFSVTSEVFAHITQHLHRLLPEYPYVV